MNSFSRKRHEVISHVAKSKRISLTSLQHCNSAYSAAGSFLSGTGGLLLIQVVMANHVESGLIEYR